MAGLFAIIVRESATAYRIAHKLRGAAAAIKMDLFPFERPPRHASFMRWLGRAALTV